MAVRVVHRPARSSLDSLPHELLDVAPTPTLDRPVNSSEGGVIRLLMPLVAGVGMLVMMASTGNAIRMFAGVAFIAVALLLGVSMYVRSKTGHRKRAEHERGQFIEYLQRLRKEIDPEIEQQRHVQALVHPAPGDLFSVIANPARVYERLRGDADFAITRIGSGPGPLAREVRFGKSSDPAAVEDAISAAHMARMRKRLERIDGLPLTVPLSGVVSIIGSEDACHAALRAALTQYITVHAPEDAVLHLCIGRNVERFDWLRFVPHLQDKDRFDGPANVRRVSSTPNEMANALNSVILARASEPGRMHAPFVVVVVDRGDANGQDPLSLVPETVALADIGVCVVTLSRKRILEPGEITTRVDIDPDGRVVVEELHADRRRKLSHGELLARGASEGSLDDVPDALAETIARTLAPIRLAEEAQRDAPLESTVTIESLLELEDIGTFDPLSTWRPREIKDFLRVPFGIDVVGHKVYLDLKESALEGHGPHGLCIGATGSGKSEVLRTMVLAMAINHPPERLALVLVDYKGGAAFSGLDILPHTAAMVDNLGDQEGLVDRLHDAICGEMLRRQRVLQDAGAKNVYDYNDRRDAGADLDPLPNLVVIIDEFGEILVQKPDFIDLFVQIGRIGRSIGVYLLLASQRLEEGKLRGLESHLSYRLGLRTFSAPESRAVIGTPDAHQLPALPGSGYLKVDPDVYTRFKAAYVSSRYEPAHERINFDLPPIPIPYAIVNGSGPWLEEQQVQYTSEMKQSLPPKVETPFDKIALVVAAERMAEVGTKVPQLWLPPLSSSVSPDEVLGAPVRTENRGIQSSDQTYWGTLSFPLGLADDPGRQWQGPWVLETAAANAVILGAPQTGKSSTAKSLVLGSALTHTPREIAWYIVDAASTGLAGLADLPHVGGVATRFEPDRIRRAIAEVSYEMRRREAMFATFKAGSVEEFRRRNAAGDLPDTPVNDIYLMVDGWAAFSTDFEELLPVASDLVLRGLNYGIHVIIVTNRIADMRMNLQTNINTMVEHRLTNPVDSMISRPLQARLSATHRGRMITPNKLITQVIDPGSDRAQELFGELDAGWSGPAAPPIRMLPDRISYAEVVELSASVNGQAERPALVGVDEATLSPVRIDLLGNDNHALVFGDGGSGRTTFVRSLIGDLASRPTDKMNVVVIDPRRALLDFIEEPLLRGYATTRDVAATMITALAEFLSTRLPGSDVTPTQLRERSWWSGAEMVLVVEDYDLLVSSSTSNNPLMPLVPLIPQAADVGLHVVLVRKASGVSRAMFDPVLSALRDGGAVGVLLSGDRAEGQIYTKVYLQEEPPGRGRIIRRGERPSRAQFVDWKHDQRIVPVAPVADHPATEDADGEAGPPEDDRTADSPAPQD